MNRQRKEFAVKVRRNIHETENSIDLALANLGDTTSAITKGRIEVKISALAGQDGIDHLMKAQQLITQARREMGLAHERLAETQRDLGIAEIASGDLWTKPPAAEESEEQKVVSING